MIVYSEIESVKPYIYEKNNRRISVYFCLPMNEFHAFYQCGVKDNGEYLMNDVLDIKGAILTPVDHSNRAEWLKLTLQDN